MFSLDFVYDIEMLEQKQPTVVTYYWQCQFTCNVNVLDLIVCDDWLSLVANSYRYVAIDCHSVAIVCLSVQIACHFVSAQQLFVTLCNWLSIYLQFVKCKQTSVMMCVCVSVTITWARRLREP